MKRSDLTSGVKPPKFRVGKYILNEYEVREMIARISEGTLNPEGITIKDEKGTIVKIDPDGTTTGNLYGFGISSRFMLRKIKANRLAAGLK